jgi:hypothetical protein
MMKARSNKRAAHRSDRLARAKDATIEDLVVCSGGLYVPAPKFRTHAAAIPATKAE